MMIPIPLATYVCLQAKRLFVQYADKNIYILTIIEVFNYLTYNFENVFYALL